MTLPLKPPQALRRHFREELNRGALDANGKVAQTLLKRAIEGNVTAAIFGLKCRAHWREEGTSEPNSSAAALFIVALEKSQQ
jgi:hypothetical protein